MDVKFRKTNKAIGYYQKFKKRKENKEINKTNWVLSLLLFVGVFSGFLFSLQAAEVVDFSDYPTLSAFYGLFPSVAPLGAEIKSYISPEASGFVLLTAAIAVYITNTVLLVLIPYYGVYSLITYKVDDEPEPMIVSRLVVLLLLASSFNMFTVDIKHDDGQVSELSMIQYVMLEAIGTFVHSAEELAMIDLDEYYLTPSTTTVPPLFFKDDFATISKNYIKSTFENGESGNIDLYKNDSKYKAVFSMGGTMHEIKFLINKGMNGKSDSIDIASLEEAFVNDYFQYAIDHAVKVEKVISQTEVTKRNHGNSEWNYSTSLNNFDLFEGYYYEHCDNIYSLIPPQTTSSEWRATYIEIAAMCASRNFIAKHYSNSHYDYLSLYEGEPLLKKGNTLLFGDEEANHEMKYADVESNAMTQCGAGYLACVESAEFYFKLKSEKSLKYGILHNIFKMLNSLFFEMFEESMVLLNSKVFDVKPSGETTVGALKISGDGFNLLNSFIVPSHETHYEDVRSSNIYLNASGSTYSSSADYSLDIQDYVSGLSINDKVTQEEVSHSFLGFSPLKPFKRAAACLERPEEISNGFRCEKINKELMKAGVGSFKSGFTIWTYSMLDNMFGMRIDKRSGGGMEAGSAWNKGAGSKVKGALGAGMAVGVAEAGDDVILALMGEYYDLEKVEEFTDFLGTTSVKENPYYMGDSLYAVVATQTISKAIGSNVASNFWDGMGKMLLFIGAALIYLVVKFIYVVVKMIFAKLFEIIVETMMISMLLVMKVNTDGFVGIQHKYREFVADVGAFCVYIVIASSFVYFLDAILIIFSKEIIYYFRQTTESVEALITGSLGFAIHLLVIIFVMMKLQDMLESHLSSVVDQLLKKQNVNTEQALR